MLEILDGGAFAQEFRVRHHGEFRFRVRFADDALDLVAGADRHGRLGDHHREAVERARDFARGIVDEAQVGVAVTAARRRAHRDEHRIGGFHRAGEIVGEFEPARARIGGNQVGQPRLVDRHLTARQRGNLGRILVDAGHVVAEIGKAGPGNEADIAGADHGNAHQIYSFNSSRASLMPSSSGRGAGCRHTGRGVLWPLPAKIAIAGGVLRCNVVTLRILGRANFPNCRRN